MNNRELVELLKYSSPNSILVVTWRNKLVELYCPFTVYVKQDIGSLIKTQIVNVASVKLATNLKTVFIIEGKAYYFFYFDILVIDE